MILQRQDTHLKWNRKKMNKTCTGSLLIPIIVLVGLFVGCPNQEKLNLQGEVNLLRQQIKDARDIEDLRTERNELREKLETFTTRPEVNSESKKND